jgi:cell division protein FtsZ
MFELTEKLPAGPVIKVIGVGGAGGNAVEHMIESGVNGVEFVCANTDAQALRRSRAPLLIQLGSSGLGAGARPAAGREAAIQQREQIADALRGANMVFITAGMGGGTGTGAAPVVAEVAREQGILTVAVVTKPFGFEGKRLLIAEQGLEALVQNVDSLIVILNDKLMEVMGEDVSMQDAFRAANDVLRNAVAGIAEIINVPGLVNADFEDVRTVMSEVGMAMMGSAVASGVDRARLAAEQAVASPLLEGVNLAGARGVLVNITASAALKMKEVNEVMTAIRECAAEDATIIFGAVFDEAMEDRLRVTVVATGVAESQRQQAMAQKAFTVVTRRNGSDNQPVETQTVDYGSLDMPAAMRKKRFATTIEAMEQSGVDKYDIPAFLRKQAD